MLKLKHKFYLLVILVFVAGGLSASFYYKSQLPRRSGHIRFDGLSNKVRIDFDKYGVAHIKASNEIDAQKALGYIHAQDRLYQMEMLRRIGSGELSSIAGPKTVKVDELFKTLNIRDFAKKKANLLKVDHPQVYAKVQAYLDGINTYQKLGPTPVEFSILNISKRDFTIEDVYVIMGFVSFSFDKAFKTDVLLSKLKESLNEDYIKDLDIANKSERTAARELPIRLLERFAEIQTQLDKYPKWDGSNAWLVSADKSKSEKALFANDTHIAISTPPVWWEARISYPGYDTYGYFMSGIPFPILGNTNKSAWGITIFHKDSTDYFKEKRVNDKTIARGDKEFAITSEKLPIKIRDHSDYSYTRYKTELGPLLKDGFSQDDEFYDITISWDYLDPKNKPLWGLYVLSHARNKEEVLAGIRPIRAPSLNIFYANVEGDIMHATTGRIKDYEGNNPNFIMDPPFKDQFRSYPFETNPFLENPEGGVIYNANQQPYKGVDGYYDYPSRYRVLGKFFKNAENVSVEDTKKLQLSAAISYDKIVLDSVIPILEKKKRI